MTRDDRDFEAQVRLALGEHAGDAPQVDLADAALSKARGIRRRRTALSAAAALVTVAVAVPVGAQLMNGDANRDNTATGVTSTGPSTGGPIVTPKIVQVQLAGLQTGDAPRVPYIDGDTFVDASGDEHAVAPAKGSFVTDAASIGGGQLIFEQNNQAVISYTAVGGSSNLPQAKSVTPPAIDQDTKAAAFAVHDADASSQPAAQDTLVYATALDDATTVETDLDVRQVMGAYKGRVVFNATDATKGKVVGVVMMTEPGGAVSMPYSSLKTVTAVSPNETLLAGILSDGWLPGEKGCAVMVQADTQETLWSACPWNLVEFSPDGTQVLAIDAGTEGLGVNHLAVLDAQTGDLVAEYTTNGVFGRATFDGGSDSIVMVAVDGAKAALVRCPTDGTDCELASPTSTVTPDDPDAQTRPYQLTAN